jgi:hypothetical protein
MKKKEYQLPQSINVTWTYDIFTAEGKPPTRGFGGRLYFYNEKSQAIPVEGELTVYGFDDTHRSHDGLSVEAADKRFRFTAEQFTTHFSESQLGASYSVWIPWDVSPGYKKKIMLVPTFKTKDGRVIRGNAATVLLPGPPSEEEQVVIQASAKKGSGDASKSVTPATYQPQPKTTTIPMPSRSLNTQPRFTPEQAAAYMEQIQRGEFQGVASNSMGQVSNGVHHSTLNEGVLPAGNFVPTAEQAIPMASPTSSDASQPVNRMQTITVPASSVATPLPGFAMANASMLNTKAPISGTQMISAPQAANSLPQGLTPGLIPSPAVHSSPNLLQAPASSAAPSSSYPSR